MIVMISALLAQTAAYSQLVHDGGVCVGISWVQIAPNAQVTREPGPDFNVYRFNGPAGENDHWWAVYSGRYANADADGPILIQRDGVTIRRAVKDGKFEGYIGERDGRQNHFFGSIFSDTSSDLELFARVDFGPTGQALCEKSN